LGDRDIIVLPPGSGMRMRFDAACAAIGIRPRVAFEAGDPHVLAHLASSGLGVAIVPESVSRTYADQVHAAKIVKPALRGILVLAWRSEGATNPAARAFIAQARETLPDPRSNGTRRPKP
jgi:DNA-binding transcriptional LysR family regulator